MRRLLAGLVAVVVLLTFAPVVLASDQGSYTDCPTNDTTKFRLWENAIGDTTHGNDTLIRCGPEANLSTIDVTTPSNSCFGTIFHSDWNDCGSSITVFVPAGSAICLYDNAGYDDLIWYATGPKAGQRYDIPGDRVSSIRWSWPCN